MVQVLCTSFATARYIVEKDRRAAEVTGKCMNGTVYVVGENGLLEELRSHGIRAIGGNEGRHNFSSSMSHFLAVILDTSS